MLICIGYYPGGIDQAIRLAAWLKEIGPFPGHRLLVARDVRSPEKPFMDVGFDSVTEIVVSDDAWNSWPQSANNVFRKCVVYNEYVTKEPYWLWIEPDVVPLHQGAFDILEAEYKASGLPFLGDKVVVEGIPTHMSGVGIYPLDMSGLAGEAKVCMDLAWDMAAKDQIVPQMYESKYIMHAWKHPSFENWDAVEREIYAFKQECVLFHASKDGSLINLLRERRNSILPVSVLAEPPASMTISGEARESPASSRGGQKLSASILIKSYPLDYPLLKYSLKSVEKFARGFDKVVLVVPDDHPPSEANEVSIDNLRIVQLKEEAPGYAFQQAVKANAHNLIDSDYIMHIDSDTALTTEVTPETFFTETFKHGLGDPTKQTFGQTVTDKRPTWFITPYDQTSVPWKAATEAFIGHAVDFEFMRRLPMFVPRKVHEKAASFCLQRHGMDLHRYIMQADHFSEFNALGAIAFDYFHLDIHWFNTAHHPESEWPALVALQTWSHGDFAENVQKFESILGISGAGIDPLTAFPTPSPDSSPDDGQGEPGTAHDLRDIEHPRQEIPYREGPWHEVVQRPSVVEQILTSTKEVVIPWANQAESEAEIKRLCRELRKFQDAPRHIDRVRKELACFQVITGDKKIKGMVRRNNRLGPNYDPMNPKTLTKKQKAAVANLEKGRRVRAELIKK